jgi:hypothetical protein
VAGGPLGRGLDGLAGEQRQGAEQVYAGGFLNIHYQ